MSIDVFVPAVIARLQNAGLQADAWGQVPSGAGWQGPPGQSEFVPYAQVTRLGSADQMSATVNDRFDDFRVDLFIRYFAGVAQDADQLAADARAVLLGRQVTVDGFSTLRLWVYNSQTTTRQVNTEQPVFEAGDFMRWWAAPEADDD